MVKPVIALPPCFLQIVIDICNFSLNMRFKGVSRAKRKGPEAPFNNNYWCRGGGKPALLR